MCVCWIKKDTINRTLKIISFDCFVFLILEEKKNFMINFRLTFSFVSFNFLKIEHTHCFISQNIRKLSTYHTPNTGGIFIPCLFVSTHIVHIHYIVRLQLLLES